ncbi:Uncharacterized protein FWK35_00037385 [Aphis craccivora]|uniref:Uncharacterized protein n=1 Tax=Aphis craccivora TaxID=307492 RepID=A0A6G0W7S9_APHCR|nr:Uncharacterized protein FWK35_00037385 [Aphis craccivora]
MSPHFINNVAITRAMDFFMDLGFKLSYNLDPTTHIKYVCCKALKTLGRVTRLIKDFRLESSLKSLFCALVRPIFKYGNLILQIMQGIKFLEGLLNKNLCILQSSLKSPLKSHLVHTDQRPCSMSRTPPPTIWLMSL